MYHSLRRLRMTNDQRISDIIERWDTKQADGQIPSVSRKFNFSFLYFGGGRGGCQHTILPHFLEKYRLISRIFWPVRRPGEGGGWGRGGLTHPRFVNEMFSFGKASSLHMWQCECVTVAFIFSGIFLHHSDIRETFHG